MRRDARVMATVTRQCVAFLTLSFLCGWIPLGAQIAAPATQKVALHSLDSMIVMVPAGSTNGEESDAVRSTNWLELERWLKMRWGAQ